jgi:hypothetical protein
MAIEFRHRQAAHCESGVCANLMEHHGIALSEALAFGIGGGLFFGYFPFIRVNRLPLTTYRCALGGILKRAAGSLGVSLRWQKFRRPAKAMEALDRLLDQGIPVGCRTGGYWLPYFPPAYRFHFNMHNLVVYGRSGGDYLISDPVMPEPVTCPVGDLLKARFAEGPLAPRGTMYHVAGLPQRWDLRRGVIRGLRHVCRMMRQRAFPLVGVRGIRFLAGQVEGWPRRLAPRVAAQYLAQLVRMQEEIGTGGAGFRFIFAAFLQEAAPLLDEPSLVERSRELTAIGDRWRDLAVLAARGCKGRDPDSGLFPAMAALLRECAGGEERLFAALAPLAAR